ncbi:GGDEF domain-containing protein [Colwellia sp. 12G3]|uniref:GGDEF domain-containing protein n=1 Tax=Colwellia sp. 12G3 TaxID=2058299 RepID=UPI000C333E1D|nr:GGDEF domain-containing protein [Colwellia sp. 12G3]PKI17624.1 GGDEF domain-containing protein [Colwellia sp. 12G3]
MKVVKDTQRSKGFYASILLVLLTLISLVLLFLNIEKHKTINLNYADVNVMDDRAVLGASVATVVKTNQGLEFTCQITKSHLAQPYCELIINLQDLSKQAPFTGLDLSNFEQIGLWIQHKHPTQPGTRIELRNFDSEYSNKENQIILKHNSLEYLEAYVTNPVWLKLNDFAIPQWWHNSHNLTLTHGGTDFSNIYSIAIAPSTQVQEGNYQLTIERIELKGQYISTATLISVLIMIWSIALGYVIRGLRTAVKVAIDIPEKVTQTIEFGTMSCPLTGALNRIGLRKCFDQLAPTDLKHLSIIFISIDYFEDLYSKNGQKKADEVLQNFANKVNSTSRSSDTLVRWNVEEFLLVCPDTAISPAVDVADKIRNVIEKTVWPNNIKITCSSGVAQMHDEDLNDLISRANRALYKAKNSGSNRTAAA